MVVNNLLHNTQPQPGSIIAGREERVEDMWQDFWRDALPRIADRQQHTGVLGLSLQLDGAARWSGLNAIEQHIYDCLV